MDRSPEERPARSADDQDEAGTAIQRLGLGADAHPALRDTGLVFWTVEHAGCSQQSGEEAQQIHAILRSRLGQEVIDRTGVSRPITLADVLVVAPYNVQVTTSGPSCRTVPGSGPSTRSRARKPKSCSCR